MPIVLLCRKRTGVVGVWVLAYWMRCLRRPTKAAGSLCVERNLEVRFHPPPSMRTAPMYGGPKACNVIAQAQRAERAQAWVPSPKSFPRAVSPCHPSAASQTLQMIVIGEGSPIAIGIDSSPCPHFPNQTCEINMPWPFCVSGGTFKYLT